MLMITVTSAFRFASPLLVARPPVTKNARSYSTLLVFRLARNGSSGKMNTPNTSQWRSLFGGASSQNLLAHMEQTANNNPTSATAQNAFYSALLRADMPAILVERYQTGQYASNAACETTYQRALERLARTEGAATYGGGTQIQGRNSMSNDQLQAIGQAVAAQSKGGQIAGPKFGSSGTGNRASPLYVVVEETTSGVIFKWAKFIIYLGLFGYLALIVVSAAVEMSGALRRVGGTNTNEAQAQHQTVRFTDVHGCDEAKEELQELVDFLKNPQKFSTLGGKLPKGVLLVGPPGTGKTLLARAVAGESGVPFFFMSGSEFDEIYVGVGAKRVRELFTAARAKAPAIIFIDELDAIGGKRNERDPAYVKQSLNQLLTELDGFSQDTGVIILAATNFPQLLDKALTRPGRFDRNVIVDLPDVRGRIAILKHHMKNIKLSPEVDPSLIARGTTGFSGAQLENLVNQAAVRASKNKALTVDVLDLEWAKDKILMGAERRSMVIQDKDKLMTAYHEAGHALVGMYTPAATPVYKVTIMPRGQTLGLTQFMDEMDTVSMSRAEYISAIDTAMGGKAAEAIVYGEDNVTSGCTGDIQNASRVAWAMVTQMGMSPTLGNVDFYNYHDSLSGSTKMAIEAEVRRFVDEGSERAYALLREKRHELDLLAKALVEYETLTLEEMRAVVRGEKLQKLSAVKGVGMKLPELVLPAGIGEGKGGGGQGGVGGAKL